MNSDARKLKALLIEDQPDIRLLLKLSLEGAGAFACSEAATGAAGLEVAIAQHPDVIILDYSLPDMDAPEIIQNLKAAPETRDIPLVVLTAKTDEKTSLNCRALGAAAVLGKPFSPREIGSAIQSILSKARAA